MWRVTDKVAAWGYPVCVLMPSTQRPTDRIPSNEEVADAVAELLAMGKNPRTERLRVFFASWPSTGGYVRAVPSNRKPAAIFTTSALFTDPNPLLNWDPPGSRRRSQVRAVIQDLLAMGGYHYIAHARASFDPMSGPGRRRDENLRRVFGGRNG